MSNEYSIEFPEVKETFLRWTKEPVKVPFATARKVASAWRSGNRVSFYGAKLPEMQDWLANGYRGLGHEFPLTGAPTRKSRRLVFSEEGDLDVDLMYSGADYPFLEWQKRPRKPGLALRVQYDVNAGTDVKYIAEYGRWIAALMEGFESQGYDVELTIMFITQGSWQGQKGENTINLICKRANEAVDYASFSALFSPGGFRMLGFTAICMMEDKRFAGKVVNSGLGQAAGPNKWDVSWDASSRTLTFNCPHYANDFPEQEMSAKLDKFAGQI